MSVSHDQFERLLSLASDWVAGQEQVALRKGAPLDVTQINDASPIGVMHLERVRVFIVPQVPVPEHPELQALCDATKAITANTAALSTRYGIWIRSDRTDKRKLLIHELVHTSQFERMGGIEPFLRQYLNECMTVGYPQAPMEQEAIAFTAKVCP